MVEVMEKLYLLSRDRWVKEAEKVGLTPKEIFEIETNLCAVSDTEEMEQLFWSIISRVVEKRKIKKLVELNGFVREFQTIANHRIFKNQKGENISFFLLKVESAKEECQRKKPKDLKSFLELTYASHLEIDNFFKKEEEKANEARLNFIEKFKKLGLEIDEDLERHLKADPAQISISHYILDWHLQLFPFVACNKPARKLAALAIYCMKRFNEEITGYVSTSFNNRDLSEFGGWLSPSGVTGAGFTAYYGMIYYVRDLSLLIIDPIGLSKKAKRKLAILQEKREKNFPSDF